MTIDTKDIPNCLVGKGNKCMLVEAPEGPMQTCMGHAQNTFTTNYTCAKCSVKYRGVNHGPDTKTTFTRTGP